MKVLIVSAFPPDLAPEANHALHISEHLVKAGHVVHVLSKKGSIGVTEKDLVVHPVMNDWSWSDLPRLAKCLKSCKPDVVLLIYVGWIYHYHPMITFLPTICKTVLPGIPCVTQFESVEARAPSPSFLTWVLYKGMVLWAGKKDLHWLFGTMLRDSARIIALSGPHRTRLVNQDSAVEKKSVILPPPPLMRVSTDPPASVRKQVRDAIGAAENDFVLIYWGYIYPGKGVDTLLKAFRIAYRRNSNLRLVLVGGNLEIPNFPASCCDYFQMVQELPETLGIAERVTWTGHFNWDSDMGSRYLHAGDVCILPADWGITLNNSSLAAASTHGLPVIGTELFDGPDEGLEHGRNIYLCKPQDPEILAEAIQVLSENPEFRERIRMESLQLARDWHCWENMTKRLVGVLESAESSRKVLNDGKLPSVIAMNGVASHMKEKVSAIRPPETDRVQGDVRYSSSEQFQEQNGNTPFVSVIVAAYNVEKYLSQCLDSLVNQTLKNIEIIVVNDASTDNTLEIMKEYEARYPTLRVVDCKKNLGVASVRNRGMRMAKGIYIGFIDGDDWVDPRMCEIGFQRASDDNSDVVITNATVFYEDLKTFGPLFDQHIRQTLDPQLKTMPFTLNREPRLLLLEPVNWTKLYKRSFLQKHAIIFEEGMNSYEDICFHFAVLVKAARISLSEDPLIFYRQNRPGQISRRTDRRVFEVFAVFERIYENLVSSNVSKDIWALAVKVHLRQFDWLLRDRVELQDQQEFFGLVAKQLQKIPEAGFQIFARQANSDEVAALLCMQRNWFHWYEALRRSPWPLGLRLYVKLSSRPEILKRIYRPSILKRVVLYGLGWARRRLASWRQSLTKKPIEWAGIETHFQGMHHRFNQLTSVKPSPPPSQEPLVEVCQVNDQQLLLSRHHNSGLGDAMWRVTSDYYLVQTVTFREGDTVIDIGAHVGVLSIYLAKKFPFIKVYAIEPDPENYDCLKRNVALNGVANVTIINKAISGDGRKKILHANHGDSGWATINTGLTSAHQLFRTTQVDTMTLEELFRDYAIGHCRVLKVTALGAVHESLQAFVRQGAVDLICGEVDLADCPRAKLEWASWRIARQHFWRTISHKDNGTEYAWMQQSPTKIEPTQDSVEFKQVIPAQLVHGITE